MTVLEMTPDEVTEEETSEEETPEEESPAEPAEGQVPGGDYEMVPETDHDVARVALEVISGHWGRGRDRVKRLEAAGYDVVEVRAEMDRIFDG